MIKGNYLIMSPNKYMRMNAKRVKRGVEMQEKIGQFCAQYLPPTSLLHALMQLVVFTGLGWIGCVLPEAGRDHIPWTFLFLEPWTLLRGELPSTNNLVHYRLGCSVPLAAIEQGTGIEFPSIGPHMFRCMPHILALYWVLVQNLVLQTVLYSEQMWVTSSTSSDNYLGPQPEMWLIVWHKDRCTTFVSSASVPCFP